MKRLIRSVLPWLAVWILSGCAQPTQPDQPGRPQAWLKPGVRVQLPPAGIAPALNTQQLLSGSFKGQTQSLLVMLHADQHKLSLAGLSSVGIRLFLLTYDEKGIHTEQSIVVPQLPPASQVLADVMLSHWPIAAWLPQLPQGWTLQDVADRRELRDAQGTLITRITYLQRKGQREPVSIEQRAFNYHITIRYLDD
ncbi:hypothetical protein CIG19_09720 [Enterobacterales bacterium CwR94]|nr:hypothetical protein CIG19_09720 [Enterobacterales bacterium CwR94]